MRKRIEVFDPQTLIQARMSAGLTRRALEGCAGVSHQTIRFWEYGTHRPSVVAFRKVLEALLEAEEAAPPDWIFSGLRPPSPQR